MIQWWQSLLISIAPSILILLTNIIVLNKINKKIEIEKQETIKTIEMKMIYKKERDIKLLEKRFDLIQDFYKNYIQFKFKYLNILSPAQVGIDSSKIEKTLEEAASIGNSFRLSYLSAKVFLSESSFSKISELDSVLLEKWNATSRIVLEWHKRGYLVDNVSNEIWKDNWKEIQQKIEMMEESLVKELRFFLQIDEN